MCITKTRSAGLPVWARLPGSNRPLRFVRLPRVPLVRQMLRDNPVAGLANATALLTAVKAWPGCQFWGDSLSYVDIDWRGVVGHKQVTDAYLVALAKSNNVRLASFDRGLAALRPDLVDLVPLQ